MRDEGSMQECHEGNLEPGPPAEEILGEGPIERHACVQWNEVNSRNEHTLS